MEELSALMYVNQFRREQRYDRNCSGLRPHGGIHALREHAGHARMVHEAHLCLPARVAEGRAPIANRVALFELPSDNYFANVQNLFGRLAGIDELLEDRKSTSVRLVTNSGTHGAARDPARVSSISRSTGWPWTAFW